MSSRFFFLIRMQGDTNIAIGNKVASVLENATVIKIQNIPNKTVPNQIIYLEKV